MTPDTQAPDFTGIAKRLAEKKYPSDMMPDFDGEVSYGSSWRNTYASCMEARLRSDWETIRLLREMKNWASLEEDAPMPEDIDAHLSKLLEPFTP